MGLWHTQTPKRQGRHPKLFFQVVADTSAEFLKAWADLESTLPKDEAYLRRLPFGERALTKRGQTAVIFVAATPENRKILEKMGSAGVPELYLEILKMRLRESFFMRDPKNLSEGRDYFRERYKHLIVRLIRSEDKIPDPDATAEFEPDDDSDPAARERERISRLKKLNEWIRKQDLGRNSGLRLSYEQNWNAEKKYQRRDLQDPDSEYNTGEADWISEFRKMTESEQREWLSKPWNKFRERMLLDLGISIPA